MRISFFCFLILGLTACKTIRNLDSEATTIKLMTYNIRMDTENDQLDRWDLRKADMVDYINEQAPDFFGVQEALAHQVNYLDATLTAYNYIGVGRDDGKKEGEFMALFYKKKDWQIVKDSTFWLSSIPSEVSRGWDAACHRTATVGHFINQEGKVMYLVNTHFDHVGTVARQNSTDLLIKHIKDLSTNLPFVVMGDFNFTPDNPNYQRLTAFFDDTFTIAQQKELLSEGTFNGFKSKGSFDRRIDYIFTKSTTTELIIDTPQTAKGRQLSDHFPVIVKIVF